MDMPIRKLALCASFVVLLPVTAPRAAGLGQAVPLTPEQSASLDQAIRLWTNSPAGHRRDAGADYAVTPEGDGYRVTKPMPSSFGPRGNLTVTGGGMTALAHPLAGGRWDFDDVRFLTPFVVTTPTSPGERPVRFSFDAAGQAGHVLIDPSLATQSTFNTEIASGSGSLEGPKSGPLTFRAGAQTSRQIWLPVAPGRIDDLVFAQIDDLSMATAGKTPAERVEMAIDRLSLSGAFRSLSLARLADLIVTLRDDLPNTAAPATPAPRTGSVPPMTKIAAPALPPAGRALMRRALGELRELGSSVDVGFSADDIALSLGGHNASVHRVALSEGAAAPDGRADLHMRIELDGLASRELPPVVTEFLPRHLVLAPRLTGISADGLFDLMSRGLGDPPPSAEEGRAAALALLSQGPASLRFDEVAFDSGPASLHAAGSLQVAGPRPSDVTGSADIEVRNFNELLRRAASNPLLKKAVPVLILMKCVGDERAGVTHWHVTFAGGRWVVNGTDLSILGH